MKKTPAPFVLERLPGSYAFCRLPPEAHLPTWASGDFVSICRSRDELSVLCPQACVPEPLPAGCRCDRDFGLLRVRGTVEIDVVGLLRSLSTALADGGVSVTVIGTFDTDYMLIRERNMARAVVLLEAAGFPLER
ncbi:MAG: ACT domain-containing protein [Phycisphaerales bacterium]